MNLAIVGCGTMGRIVRDMALTNSAVEHVYSIEPALGESLFDVPRADVIIDFSHPDALDGIFNYVRAKKGAVGVVFATTGFCAEDEEKIRELAETAPVIKSSNFSLGINTMKKIIGFSAPLLMENADIEIIEKHHNQKADAPSGTAVMLADVCDGSRRRMRKCGRCGEEKRKDEIGIHSVRGGTIFGEHTVIFALKDEVIEIKHTAFSKKIFAKGAVEAALWLEGKPAGMYPLEKVFY